MFSLGHKSKKIFVTIVRKLHVHLVNKDFISVLSIGEKAKTRRLYKRKYKSSKLFVGNNTKIKNNHSIMNFV